MIKLFAIGNLGADAELKNINGAEFISFRIADNRSFIGSDGLQRQSTTWLSCSMDAERKKLVEYLKKGQKVYIEGFPTVRAGRNQEGQDTAYMNVYVHNLEFCSAKDE